MSKQIISQLPIEKRVAADDGSAVLKIAECFSQTIQGEGFYSGVPSIFLRLQNCTLNCHYCDTTNVWKNGNPYSIRELLQLWEETGVLNDLSKGHHLIVTGGSPLLQQDTLLQLFVLLLKEYNIDPFIEIENECVLMPNNYIGTYVNCWNNSPKLMNSAMRKDVRYKPTVLRLMSKFDNSWFKFVVNSIEDWFEIREDFIEPGLIRKDQVILMPEGTTREQLQKNYEAVVAIALQYNVRMCDRLQVTLWNQTTGV